ncbi:MAG: M28 family peptidase [Spirochaetales bacterium]|jgi:acetylornithine deacetylase/succinyl-diaminopimelate desuccinylase-like protein|nr:M28 family peptidase [Spirochaetales bacterium]
MKSRIAGFFSKFLSFARKQPEAAADAELGPRARRIVSDAVLFNEIPSPTEKEAERIHFIQRRLNEFGVSELTNDGEGSVAVLFPGSKPTDKYVLLFADIENDSYSPLDSSVRLSANRAAGSGLADNAVGVATLLVLAEYFQQNGVRHDINIVLLFTRLACQNEEFAGLRRFLASWDGRISFAFYVTGIQQGNIETHPLGHYKMTVTAHTSEHEVMENSREVSAVWVLSNIAFRLGTIKWDSKNNTTLNIARIVGGVGFGFFPSDGFLELEIYSADTNALDMTKNTVEATIQKIAEETGTAVEFTVNSFIPVGNPEINAFLTDILKKVHTELKIKSHFVSVPDKTAILNSFGIPAASIGITRGKKGLGEEYVELAPIETGFRQLLLLLEKSIIHGELHL